MLKAQGPRDCKIKRHHLACSCCARPVSPPTGTESGPALLQVYPEVCSFEVKVDGFSHKLPLLAGRIFQTLADLQVPSLVCLNTAMRTSGG